MQNKPTIEANIKLYEQQRKKTIYIAGSITGVKGHRKNFKKAEKHLKKLGYETFNPTDLPQGMEYKAYLRIGKSIIDEVDAIYLLSDWETSVGAIEEYKHAKRKGKEIYLECTNFKKDKRKWKLGK